MSATFISTSFLTVSFNGRSGAGTISVPGVKSGDAILLATSGGHAIAGPFVALLANDNEVEQLSSGDSSGDTFVIFLMRSAAA